VSNRRKKQNKKKSNKHFHPSPKPQNRNPFQSGKKNSHRENTSSVVKEVTGIVQANEKGFGFLIPEDGSMDVFVPPRAMRGILNGDTIKAAVAKDTRKEGGFVAVSAVIVKRAHTNLVGIIVRDYENFYLKPDDFRVTQPIFLQRGPIQPEEGKKAVAKIIKWPENNNAMEGQLIELLGVAGDPSIDIKTIIRKYQWPESFPKEVEDQVRPLPENPSEKDWAGRLDLRDKLIMTIDGADAKDFDDAISLETLADGGYVLGVHIADVSHYVSPGTPLDNEAQARSTSMYLADRVLPMLPHALSDGLCSLREGVPRLTTSAFLTYDPSGALLKSEFALSVIKSSRRGIYEEVQAVLDGNAAPETKSKYARQLPMLKNMVKLSKLIRKQRENSGALDFDFPEIRAVLDANGFVVDVRKKERQNSNKLIEDFMVSANEAVAAYIKRQGMPTLYRIHEPPGQSDLEDLTNFLKAYHVPFHKFDLTTPIGLQGLIQSVKGAPLETVISNLALRSLKLAVYSTRNAGHFGLALKSYCHFTSPIRRYPDLIVHRSLKGLLSGERRNEKSLKYEKLALHCSQQERAAEKAERESQKVMQLRFMESKVYQTFEGIVKHLTAYGAYVELAPYGIEGFLPIEDMKDDDYRFDADKLVLMGARGSVVKITDPLKVKVLTVDMVFQRMILAKIYG
jgi:ribonuclease R